MFFMFFTEPTQPHMRSKTATGPSMYTMAWPVTTSRMPCSTCLLQPRKRPTFNQHERQMSGC